MGKGIEPKPLGDVQPAPSLESHMKAQPGGAAAAVAAASSASAIPLPPPDQRDSTPEQRKDAAIALDPAAETVKETLSSPGVSSSKKKEEEAAAAAAGGADQDGSSGPKKKRATGPMDAVLHMEPPENVKPEEKPPHLTPPPYVHHFDSYSLVKQLEGGGYTQDQAITAMKAVRTLLAHNLDVAQGGLISKSDVENETYLFRAACAELSTEVKNNRRIADEQLRQQRTMLQHEVDNTSQALNQELLVLNDNVRGMFNDRKMAVREEQKKAEGTVCLTNKSPHQAGHKANLTHFHRSNKSPTKSASYSTAIPSHKSKPSAGSSLGALYLASSSWWSCRWACCDTAAMCLTRARERRSGRRRRARRSGGQLAKSMLPRLLTRQRFWLRIE